MIVTELRMTEKESELRFRNEVIALLEQQELGGKNNGLRIRFKLGACLDLPAAIDVSERIRSPRVFIVEGNRDDMFLTLGGEKLYWISPGGTVVSELSLFRHYQDTEYWETKFITKSSDLVVIYEAGVLILDANLHVVFHKKKFLNDFFISLDGDRAKFLQDDAFEWVMDLGERSLKL
jgi:hypothetical protein